MSIVITTPSGSIGSKVTQKLLDAGARITAITRHREKGAELEKRGAKVAVGSLEDAAFVNAATKGATALFWLTPPNLAAADSRGYQRRLAEVAAQAIRANSIPHVVNLSSVGAHRGKDLGPINGLHDVEKAIEAVAKNVTHIRPTFFMENYLWQLDTIRKAGALYMPLSGQSRLGMIATSDIADAVAKRLLDLSWSGRTVIELLGAADLSFDDGAAILSRVLGKTISHVTVPPEAARDAMLAQGMSADVVSQFLEMYQGADKGLLAPERPRTPASTTPTTFEEFARAVIKPALGA